MATVLTEYLGLNSYHSLSVPASRYRVWEEAGDDPNLWAPATHVGDLDGVSGSWLYLNPVLAKDTFGA